VTVLTCQRQSIVVPLLHSQLSPQSPILPEVPESSKDEENIEKVVECDAPDSWKLEARNAGEQIRFMRGGKKENEEERTSIEKSRVKEGIGDKEECRTHYEAVKGTDYAFSRDKRAVARSLTMAYSRESIAAIIEVGREMKKVEARVRNEGEHGNAVREEDY
jgi:hypothetical protein